ncbi:MAG: LysM peptidoglycan-binding domain-containing protein [Candidatus Sphingomonas phytovorans]|nr:LysM peptidoglycan-binding domain-containing protein [Sphingomonas sp.]WEK02284.1 MAG: LysM peptidoglycan-binding domain-containing protein [Sphingomonas sp.]
MVSIFTGLGAGFERGSGAMLGSTGLLGSGSIGRNNEQVSLNAATGNLLISQRDEFLVGRGPDAAIGRTYNSLGDMSDENGDNWRQSTDRRVYGLTGTVNTTGSTVKRVSGDGSEITYTWQTINLVAAYWTTDGAGAHDKLSYAGGVWTWTDGDTQGTEKYAAHGVYGLTGTVNTAGSTIKRVLADGTSSTYSWDAATSKYIVSSGTASTDNLTYAAGVWTWSNSGSPLTQVYSNNGASWRIAEASDKTSNKLTFTYSGANLTRVTTATGDYEEYVWSGGNIAQIVTSYTDGTLKTLTRTSYGYDTSNRLTTVTVDLTPGDNSIADGATYVTTYTYDGTSKRVASIGQTDGSLVTFVYDTSGRITRLTQTSAAGQFRTTVIAYSAGSTTITDPLGKVTTLDYNSDGSLKKVTSPPAYTGATAQVLQFAYTGTGTGDVSSITDALGAVTAFTYDAAGNVLTSSDRLGNVVTRTYGSKNEVLTETRTGSDATSAGAAHTTRYVYDTNGLLRYRISAEGSVTEYRYNGYGQQTSSLEYVDQKFTVSGSDSESYLNGWVLGLADRSAVMRTDTGYDARGNAVSSTTYESLSASGTVTGDPVAIQAGIGTAVSPQPNGLTRVTKTSGTTAWDADASSTMGASGDFVLQISPTQVFNSQMIGVSQNPSSSASYDSLQYAFYFIGGSVWRSNGGGAYSLGTTLAVGDNFWLVRTGTTISFLKGATLEAASSAGALYSVGGATGTFYFDCSLNSAGTATDVKFTPAAGVSISSGVGTAVSLQPNGLTRVTKISGTTGWDADASSTMGASGDFVLQVSPTQVFNSQMIGVSQNPLSSASYDSLQYAFYFIGGSVWRSNGGGVYSLGTTLAVGDNFWLVRTGTTISYLKGATLEAARSAGALYSVDGAIGTFYFDCSLNSAGTVSDVAFMPVGTAEVTSRTSYTYDQAGQLLRRAGAGFNAETFIYDGLGRVIASVDLDGNSTSIAFNDAAMQTVVTLGNGFTRTSVYNKAGELNSVSETGDNVTASTFYSYTDQMGRLRTDGPNSKYYLYDNLGRKVADIGRYTGDFTEYRYDANNRLVTTIRYATALTSGQFSVLGNHLVQVELSSIRPDSATTDLWTWNVYDAEDRLVQAINGDGAVTTYQYDASGRLVGTTAFANKLSAAQLAALKTGSLAPIAAADAARDSVARNFYDKAGLLIGVLDGEGYLSQITYDNAGRKVRETAFATATDASLRASGTFLALVGSVTAAANPADRTVRYVYDAQGNLRFEVDGLNHVTEYLYTGGVPGSAVAVPRQTIKYAGTIATLADYRIATVKAAVAVLASDANNRINWTVLNGSGRAAYTIDATGAVISYRYDALGQVTKIVRFDTLRTTASLPDLATMDAWSVANTGAAANRITRNYYSARGELRYSVDGEGYVTRFIYDQYGRPTVSLRWDTPIVTTDDTTIATIATLPTGSGTTNSTAYDYLNRVVSRTDGAGVVTTYVYNANGTLGSTYQAYGTADQTQTVYTYDNAGQVLTRTDAYGTAEQTLTSYTYDGLGNILTVTDPNGSVTTSSYDRLGRLLTRTNALSGVVAYQYNGFGEAVKATDPRGSASYTYYDRLGRVISTRDADNYVTERVYTAFGELASVTRRYNRASGTASDTTPPAPTADAARDATVSFQYDRAGQVASKTDALGAVTTYGRNAFGDVITEVDPLENGPATTIQTTRTYDKRGLLKTEVVDSAAGGKALTTSYGYDAFGRVLTLTDPASQNTIKTYDREGRVLTVKNALNQTTSYSYDKRGNLAAVQDALGKITRYAYDKNDRLIYAVDALGGVTQKSYDNDGRVILSQSYASAISLTGLATVTTTAAIAAALAARVSPSGNNALTRSVYDADGRLRYTVDAANFLTEFVYDAAGNAIRSIAYSTAIASSPTYTMATIATQVAGMSAPALAAARTTRNVYTAEGKRSFTIDALGNVTAYRYDAQGNVVKQQRVAANYGVAGDPTDAAMTTWLTSNGNTTNDRISSAIYDRNGQLRFDVDAEGYVTQYTYNAAGSVRTKIRYATNTYAINDETPLATALALVGATPPTTAAVTEFKYDSAGRLTETIDPLGTRTVMTLNLLGQALTTAVAYGTPDESVTTRTYDALGRVLTETRASGQAEATTRTFTYDAVGNKLTEKDGRGNITTRTYDALGHLLTITEPLEGSATALTTNSYDAFGNLVKVIDPRSNASYFYYDALGRIISTRDADNYVTERVYTAFGELASVTRRYNKASGTASDTTPPTPTPDAARDATVSFQYDRVGQVASKADALGAVTTYGRNAFGDVITEVDPLENGPATTIQTTRTYDKRGMLKTEVVDSAAGGKALTTSYGYDAFGRVLTLTDPANQVSSKVYDRSGLLVSSTDALNQTTSYSYDKRGNLAAVQDALGKITRYAYDKNDRLIYTVDALGGVTQKSYDNDGRVILSQSYASAISLTGLATVTTTAAIAAALAARVSPSGNNALTRSVYDADGRLRYTVDAANFLTEFVYDAAGNAIRSIAYSTAIASSPTYTMATIATQVAGMSAPALAAARTTRNVYTAEGKRSFTIDALGNVTAYSYDAQGNVVKQQRVAANYGTTGDPTDAAMTTWLSNNASTTADRISRAIYDQAGRLRFEAIEYRLPSDPDPDPAPKSYVTQYTYDAQGNVRTKIRYADRYAVTDATSLVVALGLVGATPPATAAVTEFKYDSAGRLIETIDPSGVRTVMTLNKLGQALTTAVAYGTADESVTSRTYDALGRVLTETRASGRSEAATRTFTYDSNGNLLTEQVGLNIITRTYDALGQVLTVAVSLDATTNAVTTNSYDAFGNLVKVTDPRGNSGYFYYDALGRLVLQVDPERYATETTYTFAGQTASVTRYATKLGSEPVIGTKPAPVSTPASDSVSTFTYDKLDRVTSTIQVTDTNPANNIVESYGYNAFGDRVTVINKLGGTTTNSFDKRGLLIREVLQIDSSGATITNSYAYDARGNRLSAIEAGGLRTTTYTYDLLDQLKTKTVSGVPVANATFTGSTAQAMVESYVYDKRGNLVQVTDANNGKSFLFYDGLGRKTAEISRVGTLTTYKLDVNGNITAMQVYGTAVALPSTPGGTPPAGGTDKRETLYNYDRNNRLTSTVIKDVQYSEYPNSLYLKTDVINSTEYDAAGNVVRQTDGRGNSVYTYYDRLNRKIASVDQERYLTSWTLDAEGNVLSERRSSTQLAGADIGTLPGATANLIKNSQFAGTDGWYSYNPNNILNAGSPFTGGYMGKNFLKDEFTATAANQSVSLRVDGNNSFAVAGGERVAIQAGVEGAGTVGRLVLLMWWYDSGGNTVRVDEVGTLNGSQWYDTKISTFATAPAGAVSGALELYAITSGAGSGFFTLVEPTVRLVDATQATMPAFTSAYAADRVTTFTYDRNGRRLTETRGAVETSAVGGNGALSSSKAGSVIRYEYNGLGQVTKKTEANLDYTRHEYDYLGRETRTTQTPFVDYRQTQVTPTTDITYNGLNQVLQTIQRGDGTTADRITTYTYDAGRLTGMTDPTGFSTSYYYDTAGQLVAQTYSRQKSNGSSETNGNFFSYDAAGREISRKTGVLNGSTWTFGDTTDEYYNGYGEIVAQGTNTGGVKANAQQFADYDKAGRVWRTNFKDGITKVYAYDKNGNATMLLQSAGTANLKSKESVEQIFADLSGVSVMFSVFDKRNQLIETFQQASNNIGANPIRPELIPDPTGHGVASFYADGDVAVKVSREEVKNNPAVKPAESPESRFTATGGGVSFDAVITLGWQGIGKWDRRQLTISTDPAIFYGSGVVHVTITDSQGTRSLGDITPGRNFIIEDTTYTPFSSFIFASGAVSFTLTQEVPGGQVVIAQTSMNIEMPYPGPKSEPPEWKISHGDAYPAPKLHFQNENANATVVQMFVRPTGSGGAYQKLTATQLNNSMGSNIAGWFTYDLTQSPFNGLPANSSWDIKYLAMDAAGKIYDSKQAVLSRNSNGSPVLDNVILVDVRGPGQAMLTNDSGRDWLILSGLPAAPVNMRYRPLGSSGGWSVPVGVNPAGYGQNGLAAVDVTGVGGPVEYWVELADGTKLHGTLTVGGQASLLTQYKDASREIILRPPPGQTVTWQQFRYFRDGAWSSWIPQSGGGNWTYNAKDLADFYSSRSYPIEYETYNVDTLVSRSEATLTFGYDSQSMSTFSGAPGMAAKVLFDPKQNGVAKIVLYWRDRGSTGAFTAVTISKAGGIFAWDVDAAGVRPGTGTRNLEYYYDAYAADNTILPTLNHADHAMGYLAIQSDRYADTTNNALVWRIDTAVASQYLVHRTQSFNAFGEIASETDGNGRITSFNYNTMGRLTGKISPQVDVTDESGVTTRQSPTEYYYYDQSGRLVGKRDANQKFFTQTLLAGSGQGGDTALTIGEFNPDNSQKAYGYDIFGDLRKITDGLGAVTNNTYDKAGRLIQVDHPVRVNGNSPGVRLVDYYSYDGLGQRIKHSNSVYGGTVAETTDYDVQGRVVSTVSFGGLATTYSYTWYSIASNLLGTIGLGNFGGWQTITTNSAGLNSYENRGLFGQINWRQDFGGHSSHYTYDLAGHLVGQTGSTGQSISYTYYNNGYIASITDNTLRMRSTFQYDNEGNRTLETYNSTDASPIIYQNASVSYDELNRVVRFKDAKAEITYKYDANGNRREVKSIYNDGVDGTERTQDYWYKYDSMNRFVLTMGTLLGGNIVAGNAGVALTYDPAGNRKTATTAGSSEVETYTYTADGYLEDTIIAGVVRARRTNDALGRVTSYTQFAPDGAVSFTRTLTYDRNNRVTDQTETDAANGNVITTIHNDYRAYVAGSGYTGLDQGVITHSSLVKSTVTTETVYSYEWWDEAKQLAIRVDPTDRSNPNTGQWASGFSRLSYDENGHLKQVVDTQANRVLSYRNDAYGQVLVREEKINNVLGARQLYYYFDGRRIGDVGNSGPSPSLIDYAQELALDRNAPRDKGGFRNGRPVESADFDQNFQPINASYPGPVAAMYTARNGDTLQSIARAAWGDANLWYLIADANGLTGNATLVAGQTLSIPNKVTNFHNTSETFRVYNPGEAIGDAMPTLPAAPTMPAPPPPKKNGCGIFGMILLVVIAVAVAAVAGPAIIGSPAVLGPGGAVVVNATGLTAILGGSAAAAGSIGAVGAAVIGGAIAGAGASIVSQGVGVALGIQDKFSWKGVALGALSGAVGGGVGSTFGKSVAFGSKFLTDVAKGVTTNVVTQGISVATGLQKKFDWAGVAVAGAVSGAVGIANRTLANAKVGTDAYKIDSNTARNVGFYANQALSGVAGSVAGGAVRSFVSGSSFGDNVLATLPDVVGSTIGSLVADGVARIGRSSGKMSPGEKAFLGEAKRSAKAVPAALANASGASSQQGDVDQPGKDIVVVARRQDRDLIGAMNTYQWGRYFAQYGQQTDESGERWALRQQQPASPPVAASRDSSVQAPSATFFGGVSRAFIQNFGALGTDEGRRAIASGLIGFARDVGLQVAPFGTVLDPTVTQRNAQRVLAFGIGTLELVPKLGMGAAQIIDGVTFGRNDLVGEGVFNTSLTTFEIVGLKGLGRGVNALTRAELVATEGTAFGAPRLGMQIPQGVGPRTFDVISGKVRAAVGDLGLGDDIFVMGSRSGGTAKAASDFDFGVRVSPNKFDELIAESFGNPKAGSALSRTRDIAIRDGRIQTGEAGLRPVRTTISRTLNVPQNKVQISVIRAGGVFDNGPQTPLAFKF